MISLAGILAWAFVAGAVGRRLCGGLWATWFPGWGIGGLQAERLLWGALCASGGLLGIWWKTGTLLAWQPWAVAGGYALAIWVGSTFGYGAGAMRPTSPREFAASLLHGVEGVAVAVVVAYVAGDPWCFVAAGALTCPLAYGLATRFPIEWPLFACYRATAAHPADPAPFGELLYGGSLAVVLTLARMIG